MAFTHMARQFAEQQRMNDAHRYGYRTHPRIYETSRFHNRDHQKANKGAIIKALKAVGVSGALITALEGDSAN